jgi:hypothetical protein
MPRRFKTLPLCAAFDGTPGWVLLASPAHWRRVALLIAKRTGRAVGLDTTRMANRL